MAKSAAHRFGQIIGDLLEEILEPELRRFCSDKGLFLDRKGPRPGVRDGKKVSWQDRYGNRHDLDFVIEKPANDGARGRPLAFIEAAWRRYTKHSKNKAQEIQGAVAPLAETFVKDAPFLGAILAGEFTRASLEQLRSHGFAVVHFAYHDVVSAFASIGIDARFDESTPEASFRKSIEKIVRLDAAKRDRVKSSILDSKSAEMAAFLAELKRKIERHVERISVIPLFGQSNDFGSVSQAVDFVTSFDTNKCVGQFQKFELQVIFSNRDTVSASFSNPDDARRFMEYVVA